MAAVHDFDPSSTGTGPPPSSHRPRPKRSQVVRACDWCRQHRTKCDNSVPCSNCKSRGARCSNDHMQQTSLPGAHREIERLRRQVEQLELELQQERAKAPKTPRTPKTPGASEPSPYSEVPGFPATPSVPPLADAETDAGIAREFWGGVHVTTARSPHKTWYGPSSLFYFINRVAVFLDSAFQPTDSHENMLEVNSAGMLLDGPDHTSAASATTPAHGSSVLKPSAEKLDPLAGARFLTLTQEEYFLDLYWQSYHTSLFAILDEAEFRAHYRSLWTSSGQEREPSALVDIVLALCMQYGVSMVPGIRQKLIVNCDDATIAGRWYYRRCQTLLEYELESPSLATLQCHILCGVYLCNGTFQNMSDSACGLAVREAYMLGIHLDPPADMPLRQREQRKRIWWALYVLDSKIGMKLGRPFLVHTAARATPALLSDRVDVAAASGSNFAPLGDDRSWLSFHLYHSMLFRIARAAHVAFYCSSGVQAPRGGGGDGLQQQRRIWDDPGPGGALEAHAGLAQAHGEKLGRWAAGVHAASTTARAGGSRPFSTDGSALEIEPFAPLWVQRQRLLLELMYHNLCVNLYRPLIGFRSHLAPAPSLAAQCAAACARHAVTLTQITHQVLSSTAILAGWHEAFQWQWNAAMTLVGFLLSHAQGQGKGHQDPSAVGDARKAVDLSITVFDIFGQSFAVAGSAAKVIRNLCTKVDFLMQQSSQIQSQSQSQSQGGIGEYVGTEGVAGALDQTALPMGNGIGATEEWSAGKSSFDLPALDASSLQDTMLMAFDIDQWIELNVLWPHTGGLIMADAS